MSTKERLSSVNKIDRGVQCVWEKYIANTCERIL